MAVAGGARRLIVASVVALAMLTAFASPASAGIAGDPQVVASGLQFPWEVVLVPDGRILVDERPGRIRVINAEGQLQADPAYTNLTGGQFLGMALDPDYATNRFVYLYETYPSGGGWRNRVRRFVDGGTTLTPSGTILDSIPGEDNHDGGRIAFGPDGKLYVATGDVHDPNAPQDLESLAGKILRINDDGTAPADNPFPAGANSKYVWSYGHRNPQGLAWDPAGRLWETEHGPSGEDYAGGRCCRDEVNLIEPGVNYGWPAIMGDEQAPGMRSPVISSGNDPPAWAPSGATFAPGGHLYFSNLLGEHLREVTLAGTQVVDQTEHFRGTFGRLRAAVYGRGALYLTTSNNGDDERVLRVPMAFGGGSPSVGSTATAAGLAAMPLDRVRPVVSGLRLSPTAFAAATRGGSIAAAAPGTTVRYRLSEAAGTRFTVLRPIVGRRVGRRCVAPTRRNRGHKRCPHFRSVGSFGRRSGTGANSFTFSGRVRGRPLRPGHYRLEALATDAAGNLSLVRRSSFRILARRAAGLPR